MRHDHENESRGRMPSRVPRPGPQDPDAAAAPVLQQPSRSFVRFAPGVPVLLVCFLLGGGLTWTGPHVLQAQEVEMGLEEAVQRTVEGSREIRDAQLALEAARQDVAEARGGLLPRLDFSMRYTRNLTPPAAFLPSILFDPDASPEEVTRVRFGADNVWTSSLLMEQPILEGRAFTALSAANRYASLREEGVRGRVHETVTRVRVHYYDLLLAQEQERLTALSLERVERSLRLARSLLAEGLSSEYEVLRLEVELANLEPALDRARNAQLEAARALQVVMGLDPDDGLPAARGSLSTLELEDPGENDPENRALLEFMGVDPSQAVGELTTMARDDGSQLRQAELDRQLRHTRLRSEQADLLPRVSVFGSYDVQAQQDGDINFFGESGQRGYGRMVGVQVSIPIFTGLQRRARIERARVELRQAETRQEHLADETDAQLQTMLGRTHEAHRRALAQRQAVTQAQRAYQIVSAQFGEGLASQLEVTDAEVALRQSEFNYAEAVHTYLTARTQLDALVGQVPGAPF